MQKGDDGGSRTHNTVQWRINYVDGSDSIGVATLDCAISGYGGMLSPGTFMQIDSMTPFLTDLQDGSVRADLVIKN